MLIKLTKLVFYPSFLLLFSNFCFADRMGARVDPFFTRYEEATAIVLASVVSVEPHDGNISSFDSETKKFNRYTLNVRKVWKGAEYIKSERLVVYTLSENSLSQIDSSRSLDSTLRYYKYIKNEEFILYLRKFDEAFISTQRYGTFQFNSHKDAESSNEYISLQAIKAGKPKEEIIPLLKSEERLFYLKKNK